MVDREWQSKQDMMTVSDAAKIKRDPKRMKAIKALMRAQMDAIEMGVPDKMKHKKRK
jgi:hypothetical protein